MGLGSSRSVNTNEYLTEIISDVITRDVSESSVGSYQLQQIVLKNTTGARISGSDMVQVASLKSESIKSSESMADLQNKIAAQLTSEIMSNATGLGLANSSEVDVSNIIKTKISNRITTDIIQKCLAMSEQRQQIIIEGGSNNIAEDVSMKQTLDAYLKCIQQNSAVLQAANDISTSLKLKATAIVENPITGSLSAITEMMTGLAGIAAIVFIVVVIIAYKFYSSTAGNIKGAITGTVGAIGSTVTGVAKAASSVVTGVAGAVAGAPRST